MTHGFLEDRALPDSLLRRTDARWKLLFFTLAALIVASEPQGELRSFPFYGILIGLLALLGRIRVKSWTRRWLAAVPFVGLAALLPFAVQAPGIASADWSASILLRGLAAAALLALLAETTEFVETIRALQQFRLPAVWVASLALAFRYVFLLAEEWQRVSQARVCRAPSLSSAASAAVMSQQLGLIFVRSWDRAERIHGAMLVRGFSGLWPMAPGGRGSLTGALFCLVFAAFFAAVRILA